MKVNILILVFLFGALFVSAQAIKLHPENPHYFLFKGKAMAIVSSSEHYGAVINPDFNYLKYLNTLKQDGMNYTRLFTGAYFEKMGSFGIEKNTLAPVSGEAILPWKRSNITGAIGGGNKFDLDQWNELYFNRLKDFISEAAARNIIVELTLFSSIYGYWDIQAWNPQNNINIKETILQENVQTLRNGSVLKYQEHLVRKLVDELNGFDNVIYEIQNEPWADHAVQVRKISDYFTTDDFKFDYLKWRDIVEVSDQQSLEWQKRMAEVLKDEENGLKNKHLIAQNYCNYFYPVSEVDPNVSIMNFHYAYPEAVSQNYGFNKVIGFDESGFSGNDDATYRKQAWRFMMKGGGLFNNLDYSFAVGFEDGKAVNKAPGGGSVAFRQQIKVLSGFIHSFNLKRLTPDGEVVVSSPGAFAQALSVSGKQYAIYLENSSKCKLTLKLPKGHFLAEWVNTLNGKVVGSEILKLKQGNITLTSPEYDSDIALKINKL